MNWQTPSSPSSDGLLFMVTMQKHKASPRRSKPKAPPAETHYRGYRRLDWDEVVYHGDYIADENRGLKLWEGLSGFRASSFVQPIYRKMGAEPTEPSPNKNPKRILKQTS